MRKAAAIFLCLFWFGVIFYMSSSNSRLSNIKSLAVVNILKGKSDEFIFKTLNNRLSQIIPEGKKTQVVNVIVRKSAHVLEFMALAFFVSNLLFMLGARGKSAIIYILFICLLYGVLDEFRQMFTGRGSMVSDVLIDFAGSCIGTLLYYFLYYCIYNKFITNSRRQSI